VEAYEASPPEVKVIVYLFIYLIWVALDLSIVTLLYYGPVLRLLLMIVPLLND
jgi:hypothetical protein